MRMALDLGLHRALEKLVDSSVSAMSSTNDPSTPIKKRSEEEERDLVVSARIWLCLYWFDHQCVFFFQSQWCFHLLFTLAE